MTGDGRILVMRKLLALCGCWPLVYTKDYDGATRLRIAKQTPFGDWTCRAIIGSVILNPDGSTSGTCYVQGWVEWQHNCKHVIFPRLIGVHKTA
jgi:hypothetical protein